MDKLEISVVAFWTIVAILVSLYLLQVRKSKKGKERIKRDYKEWLRLGRDEDGR